MSRPLVIACGALATELRAVLRADHLEGTLEVRYLPAHLHNRPERIVPELRPHIEQARADGRTVLVGYADCGTGGLLDALLEEFPGTKRLPGAHCYQTFAGVAEFDKLHDDEPGTFYLTDFLAKHFRALLWDGLGLDRHPQLLPMYFGNYTRVLLLSQTHNAEVISAAQSAADQLGLRFEHRHVGLGRLSDAVSVAVSVAGAAAVSVAGASAVHQEPSHAA